MSMSTGAIRLLIFSFILSSIFPIFAYTFTTFGVAPETFDTAFDQELLINAGIQLSEAETHNITFGGAAQEYVVNNQTMRIQWKDVLGSYTLDYFSHQQQGWVQKVLDTWWNAIEMGTQLAGSSQVLPAAGIMNATVINNFNPQYNWTRYEVVENGMMVFITTPQADDNNITLAIENGFVTVTVGSSYMDFSSTNFRNFVNWYIRTVSGGGTDWGMPDFMVWTVQIFNFILILSGIILARYLLPW